MPATNNAMDPSDIPCDIRLTILEHLIEPSPLQPELQSRSKRLVDVLELRSTCRGWQEIVDEAFWKRWALRIGHGRFRELRLITRRFQAWDVSFKADTDSAVLFHRILDVGHGYCG